MTTEWMNDSSLSDISEENLTFIHNIVFASKDLKQSQILPFVLVKYQDWKSHGGNMTGEEIQIIMNVLEKYVAPKDLQMLSLLKQQSPQS